MNDEELQKRKEHLRRIASLANAATTFHEQAMEANIELIKLEVCALVGGDSVNADKALAEAAKPVAWMYHMPGDLEHGWQRLEFERRIQSYEGMSCNEEDAGMIETPLYATPAPDKALMPAVGGFDEWTVEELRKSVRDTINTPGCSHNIYARSIGISSGKLSEFLSGKRGAESAIVEPMGFRWALVSSNDYPRPEATAVAWMYTRNDGKHRFVSTSRHAVSDQGSGLLDYTETAALYDHPTPVEEPEKGATGGQDEIVARALHTTVLWRDQDGVGILKTYGVTDSDITKLARAALAATYAGQVEAVSALQEARDALQKHYVDWDGEPEDAVPLQLARARCDATIAALKANGKST